MVEALHLVVHGGVGHNSLVRADRIPESTVVAAAEVVDVVVVDQLPCWWMVVAVEKVG